MKTLHTAKKETAKDFTPYSFGPTYHPNSRNEEYKILGHNPDAGKVGVCYSGDSLVMAWTDDKDTAAYIVKCVNSHEQLVEAFTECIALIQKYGLDYDGFMNARGIDDDYGEADEDLHDLPDKLKKWQSLCLDGVSNN